MVEDGSESVCPLNLPEKLQSWCDLIANKSAEYGLDPYLVSAVILQESGGQSEAISTSGAVGLMQVMPSDGIASGFMCINGPCFANRPSSEKLLNPEFNIDYGVRMLTGLIGKYGSIRDGLMAYGPYNVGYYYADKVIAIYEQIRE